jgi:hypothetical protein
LLEEAAVAEIVVKTTARIVEVGDNGDGRPSVTLGFEGGEDVLLQLWSREECVALAPALCGDAKVTITIAVPGGRHG